MKRKLYIDFESLYETLQERIFKKYEYFEDYEDEEEVKEIIDEEFTCELEIDWLVRHLDRDERIDLLKNSDVFYEVNNLIEKQDFLKGDDLDCLIYDAVSNLLQEVKKRIEKENNDG